MKNGKHEENKVKLFEIYTILLLIATLFMSIGYANIIDQEMTITGTTTANAQDGVFITEVTTTDENSVVNYYIGTMLDSTAIIDNESEEVTYQITIHNNADREYVYIGALTDGTDETLYSNPDVKYKVNGITEGETTIGPNQDLTFSITFYYWSLEDLFEGDWDWTLNSKINFRFREKPVIELSNEGQTYILESIYAGYTPVAYEFTVSNYNISNTNTVPMTYSFETIIDSPLQAKIYNARGEEVTGSITIGGETKEIHNYTLKIIWDESNNSTEYEGQEYNSNIKIKAIPTDAKYLDYEIAKEFNID